MEAISRVEQRDATKTAYADIVRDLLDDRYSKTLSEKTRNELRGYYDLRFVASTSTNSHPATTSTNVVQKTVKPAPAAEKETLLGSTVARVKDTLTQHRFAKAAQPAEPIPAKKAPKVQKALSWQVLSTESDVRFWEEMPMAELRALAAGGDVLASYFAFLRLRSSDSPELVKEADQGLARAFKAEFPPAQLEHALRETDAEERFFWTRKSAATAYPPAQLALGKLHVMGLGTHVDLERGLSLVRAAYDLRVPEAEAVLAELYASGIGEPRSASERPEKLFLSAARNNEPTAMLELHHRFLNGYCRVRDHLEASRWLVNVGLHDKRALEKYLEETGRARAQASPELDEFAKTLAVYAQAVIHKQPEAINRVAEWYETGSIGRKSPLRVYALLTMASESEKVAASSIDRAKSALTPHELKTAEILVGQWQRIQPDLL